METELRKNEKLNQRTKIHRLAKKYVGQVLNMVYEEGGFSM